MESRLKNGEGGVRAGNVEEATWEREESGEVARWEVPDFIQEWGTQGEY